MNKLLLCLIACLGLNITMAQSLAPEVISASGTSFNNGSSQLDWTLGEPVIISVNSGVILLTQGFHQPNLVVTSLQETEDLSISVYPNPATDFISVSLKNINETVTLELFSVDGKLMQSVRIASQNVTHLNMTTFPAGTYLLSIKNEQLKKRSFRIVKSH